MDLTVFFLVCIHTRKSASSLGLVRTKYGVDFFWFGAVRFHTALFASEPETVNKTTRVLKVIHSLVYPFNRTRVSLEADRDHLFSWVSVQLFGPHSSTIAVFIPAQKIRIKRGNELDFDSIEPNKTGVNTPLV